MYWIKTQLEYEDIFRFSRYIPGNCYIEMFLCLGNNLFTVTRSLHTIDHAIILSSLFLNQ